jgi:lipopolysaccharide transport system ATP-binding protein
MGNLSIRTNAISKLYIIQKTQRPNMLREQIQQTLKNMGSGRRQNSRKEQIWALKDVSFEIEHGESVGIIGANGAGKTTLLRILAQITAPTEGRVRLCGRVGSLLEVGTGFHAELTGRENVYLNGAILGMKKNEIDRKFDEIVEFSGVENYIDNPVKRFSTGMRMRLAFSVAAHLEPEILLVDEVLAVGDAEFQKKSLDKMENVSREGRTILFVSHNLAAVKAFCKRSMLLEHGVLRYMGDTDTALQMYLDSNIAMQEKGEYEIDPMQDVQILQVYPCDSNGTSVVSFPHDEPLYARIKIHLANHRYKFHLVLKLYNADLETVLTTRDFETTGDFLIPQTPGIYDFQVKLPRDFLNPGEYNLGAEIAGLTAKNRVRVYYRLDHSAKFEVYDNGSQLSQFNVPWQGMVHTDVEWRRL